MPPFPPNITHLVIYGYPSTSLPPWPAPLTDLYVYSGINLVSLPPFAGNMDELTLDYLPDLLAMPIMPGKCGSVRLQSLLALNDLTGGLPDTISNALHIVNLTSLTNMPSIPVFADADSSLSFTLWYAPLLSALPPLPSSIEVLHCADLPLVTAVPTLPDSLIFFALSGIPQLTSVPHLPDGTEIVHLSQLPQFTAFTDLSPALFSLELYDLPQLQCIPGLPSGLTAFYASNTGLACVPNQPPGVFINLPVCNFYNNNNCPAGLPTYSGTVYHDTNGNNQRDPGEPGIGYANVNAVPGNTLSGTGASGFYAQAANPDTYTLTPAVSNAYVTSISPASHTAMLVNLSDVDSLNDFGVQLQPNVQDLRITLSAITPPLVGVNQYLQLAYANQGTMAMSGTVTLDFDDDLLWVSSVPAPDVLAGNTATWSFANLAVAEERFVDITLQVDTLSLLGDSVLHTATIDPIATDQTPADNTSAYTGTVLASYDPNDKTVSPTSMTTAELAAGAGLTYTIRFQNTGTAPASRVIITDTLDAQLDWSSMQLLASSHTCSWLIHDGTLRFTFDPIVLPDSTSDEPGSHGSVTFRMLPSAGLTNGALVPNAANIYFDYNVPVITNTASFVVSDPQTVSDLSDQGLSLWPNPLRDRIMVELAGATNGTPFTVSDMTGRIVLFGALAGQRTTVDVSALATGTYTLRVATDAPRVFVKQ